MSERLALRQSAPSTMGPHHGLRSETGYVRKANEDQLGFRRIDAGEVYVVSDGMGGYRGGAIAAKETVRAFLEHLGKSQGSNDLKQRMRAAFDAANKAVFEKRRPEDPETQGMGATAVAVVIKGCQVLVAHVGDSRAYRWSDHTGLKPLTRDHSRVQKMVDQGIISQQEAALHPDASVLDRAIGHQPKVNAEISEWISFKPHDRLLLCSDGLSGYASDTEIDSTMQSAKEPQSQADKLIELALKKGGEDNVTVQVVQINGGGGWMSNRFMSSPVLLFVLLAACLMAMAMWVQEGSKKTDERLSKIEESIKNGQSSRDDLKQQIEGLRKDQVVLADQVHRIVSTPASSAVRSPTRAIAASGTAKPDMTKKNITEKPENLKDTQTEKSKNSQPEKQENTQQEASGDDKPKT